MFKIYWAHLCRLSSDKVNTNIKIIPLNLMNMKHNPPSKYSRDIEIFKDKDQTLKLKENIFYSLNWALLFSKLSAITYSYLRSCLSSLISFIDHIVFMQSPFNKIFSIIIPFHEDQSATSVNIFIRCVSNIILVLRQIMY